MPAPSGMKIDFVTIAWKVHFDGHGKGNFTGERQPTKAVEMQQYYYLIQKRKDELLGK